MEVGCPFKKQAAQIKKGPREAVEVKADRDSHGQALFPLEIRN